MLILILMIVYFSMIVDRAGTRSALIQTIAIYLGLTIIGTLLRSLLGLPGFVIGIGQIILALICICNAK